MRIATSTKKSCIQLLCNTPKFANAHSSISAFAFNFTVVRTDDVLVVNLGKCNLIAFSIFMDVMYAVRLQCTIKILGE